MTSITTKTRRLVSSGEQCARHAYESPTKKSSLDTWLPRFAPPSSGPPRTRLASGTPRPSFPTGGMVPRPGISPVSARPNDPLVDSLRRIVPKAIHEATGLLDGTWRGRVAGPCSRLAMVEMEICADFQELSMTTDTLIAERPPGWSKRLGQLERRQETIVSGDHTEPPVEKGGHSKVRIPGRCRRTRDSLRVVGRLFAAGSFPSHRRVCARWQGNRQQEGVGILWREEGRRQGVASPLLRVRRCTQLPPDGRSEPDFAWAWQEVPVSDLRLRDAVVQASEGSRRGGLRACTQLARSFSRARLDRSQWNSPA